MPVLAAHPSCNTSLHAALCWPGPGAKAASLAQLTTALNYYYPLHCSLYPINYFLSYETVSCVCAQHTQRSAGLVQELEQFNEQLRRIAAKRTEREEAKQREQQGRSAGAEQSARERGQDSVREAAGREKGEGVQAAAKTADPPVSADSSIGTAAGNNVAESAAAPSEKQPAGAHEQQKHGERGAVVKPQRSDSAVSRTLSLLDALLPEEKGAKK